MKRLLWSAVLAAILGTTIWAQGTKYMGGVWGKGVDGVNNGVAYKTEVPNMVGPYGQPVEMKMPYAARPPQGEDMARAMMAQSVPLDLAVHLQKGGGSGLSQAQYCGPGGCAHPSSGQGGLPPGISPPSFPTPPGGLGGMGGPGMGMGGPGMGMGGPGMGMGGPGMGMGGPGMGMGGPGMGGPGMGRPVSMNPGGAMFPQQGLNPGAQFAAGPLGGPGAVAAVGAMTGGPGGGAPFQAARTQIRFVGPTGMRISWYAPGPNGQGFTSEYLEAPGRYNFVQAAIYRLKLTNLPNRTNVTALYPTLEIVPASNKTATFLAHASVPISFTEEDIEQVVAGNFLVKVIYLPDPQFQELAATGPDEVVSTRLEPGVDPIAEALRRGSIMAIIRVGNSDLEAPNTPAMDAPPPGYNGPRPGAMPPGAMPPGAMPPGAMPPGAMPQGAPSMSTGAPIGLPGLPTRPQQPLTMSNNAGPSLVPNVPAFQGPRSNPYLAPSPIPGLPASVQGSGSPNSSPPPPPSPGMIRTAIITLLMLPALAPAQFSPLATAPLVGPPPGVGPTALLYARLDAPAGAKATWFPGSGRRELALPSVIGLRPGYIFRYEINNLPELPGVSLYPTLEVRGSLSMTSKAQPRDFPAPVILTRDDIQAVLRGSLVTKVIYLEHPERATPTATTVDRPLETTLPANRDLFEEARDQGRPVLVFRIGGRLPMAEELARAVVPGTALLPGDGPLSRPVVPPVLPFVCWPWYDAGTGPAKPDDECIHNGGTTSATPRATMGGRFGSPAGTRAGLDNGGILIGLQPSDAVAEYRDSRGGKHLIESNRVCLCIPRYQVLRNETPLGNHEVALFTTESVGSKGQILFQGRNTPTPVEGQKLMQAVQANLRPTESAGRQGAHAIQRVEILDAKNLMSAPMIALGTKAALTLTDVEKAILLRQLQWASEASGRVNLAEFVGSQSTHVVGRVSDGPQIIKAMAETRSITSCCHEITEIPGSPLLLFKCADKSAAQVGDVVTFTLKYLNQGGKPIREVALTDSLAARLEYIPGTAEADRDAVFTMQENDAGSQTLRWELNGVLQPGASGCVKFKVKVR